MAATQRILVIATNADEYRKAGYRTGLWLSELTHFLDVVEHAGHPTDIASPAGGKIPIDPESLIFAETGQALGIDGAVAKRYRDRDFMDRLRNTADVAGVHPAEYAAIYLTGGHGTMFDFPESAALAALVARFHDSGKPVSAVCHGPAGLLGVRLGDGRHLLDGRRITGFTWKEEELARRDQAVPFNLEQELQARGAHFDKAVVPFAAHVVEDGLLITGQNPASAKGVAEALLRRLAGGG